MDTETQSIEEVERFQRVLKRLGDARWEDEEKGVGEGPARPPACDPSTVAAAAAPRGQRATSLRRGRRLTTPDTGGADRAVRGCHPSRRVICHPTDDSSHFTHDSPYVFEKRSGVLQFFPHVLRPLFIFSFWKQFHRSNSLHLPLDGCLYFQVSLLGVGSVTAVVIALLFSFTFFRKTHWLANW